MEAMDNKNSSTNKLASLRTLAKDREKNTGIKNNIPPTVVEPVATVVTAPKLTSIDREIGKINKGDQNLRTITTTPITKPTPITPPTPIPKPITATNSISKVTNSDKSLATEKVPTEPQKIPKPKSSSQVATSAQATIITDTKQPQSGFFSSIINAIKSLFISTTPKTIVVKEIPKPILPVVNERKKEVVETPKWQTEKETLPVTIIPSDKIEPELEQKVKLEEPKSKTTWTPNTETGFLLLNDPNKHIINVQVVPRTNFYTSQREIVVDNLEELSNQDDDLRWSTETPKPKAQVVVPEIPTLPIPESIPVTISKSIPVVVPKPVFVPEPEPIPEPVVVVTPSLPPTNTNISVVREFNLNELKEIDEVPRKKKNFLLQTSTNILSFIIAVIVLAVLIITGVGKSLLGDSQKENLTSNKYPQALNTKLNFVFQAMVTKASLVDRINLENQNSIGNINQFILTSNETTNEPIRPSNLLNYLEINIPTNFAQSISGIYFGSVRQENPFIILKNTDNTNAKGGMLAWEENMKADLTAILKINPDLSTSTVTGVFIDGMTGGTDVRVLKNNDGEDQIVYGFANNDTIIITKNIPTFGKILELIKP